MGVDDRDWMRDPPALVSAGERLGHLVRVLGAEPALSAPEAFVDADARGWFELDVIDATTGDDYTLATVVLDLEQDLRARQVAALERLGWALSAYAGTVHDRAMALVSDTDHGDDAMRARSRSGAMAMGELGWLRAAPADPWLELGPKWARGEGRMGSPPVGDPPAAPSAASWRRGAPGLRLAAVLFSVRLSSRVRRFFDRGGRRG